ncbi:protein DMR6-LIKE OXYGENASE 2-like [Pistacia vera]|uniref:protein DMR6-LIKE OXYGENASE 2-like n=2 Tax=Pistacia vera TaxID=55513 RepID=UPI0012630A2B|nr:protein DMR6-LIKE OXYGENASE 2-like [Pistacia vera]
MSPAMAFSTSDEMRKTNDDDHHVTESQYQKGVKHLHEIGISRVPRRYILPDSDRPNAVYKRVNHLNDATPNLKLPIIEFSELLGPNRVQVLKSIAKACEEYGFFQIVNHGIPLEVISNMIDVSSRFFALPFEERAKYMSSDMKAPVRYGTSFNQNKDSVFCWRDFLKLMCHPTEDVLPLWPSSPADWRRLAAAYAKETNYLFLMLVEAILESLGVWGATMNKTEEDDEILNKFEDGSQLMVVNYYPPCPQPDLTLGMPPHSDYGFLTLLLQDEVEGLQIQYKDQWVTIEPIPNSFVVNVGDHLEIFSNGRYKSVLHRVLVNSAKSRISVASLHSLPINSMVTPSPKLIDKANPRRYKDTDFASFLEYISSCEPKRKNFLETRKLNN